MSSRQIIRVVDLETTGSAPPAHGVCEIGWQDVALGEAGLWALEGEGGSIIVNPVRQIPPITQTVHHTLEVQVADAPRRPTLPSQSLHVRLGGKAFVRPGSFRLFAYQ